MKLLKPVDAVSIGVVQSRGTAPQAVEDALCFVTFSLLLLRSFLSRSVSSLTMHLRVAVAAAAVGVAAFMAAAGCAAADFTVAVACMPVALAAVEAVETLQDARIQATR